jgi:hypothetical protein
MGIVDTVSILYPLNIPCATQYYAGHMMARTTTPLVGGYLRQFFQRRSELRDQATAGGWGGWGGWDGRGVLGMSTFW